MSRMRIVCHPTQIFFLLVCVAVAPAPPLSAQVCNQPYALCTSAPCIPDPDDPENQAICRCTVQTGDSLSDAFCADRAEKTVSLFYARTPTKTDVPETEKSFVELTTTLLTSTFSCHEIGTDGFEGMLICPPGDPWTDCLGAPCTVDPGDPTQSQAICRCPIVRGEPFLTFGGGCDPETCSTAYWSAATPEAVNSSWSAAGCPLTWQSFVCQNQKGSLSN